MSVTMVLFILSEVVAHIGGSVRGVFVGYGGVVNFVCASGATCFVSSHVSNVFCLGDGVAVYCVCGSGAMCCLRQLCGVSCRCQWCFLFCDVRNGKIFFLKDFV